MPPLLVAPLPPRLPPPRRRRVSAQFTRRFCASLSRPVVWRERRAKRALANACLTSSAEVEEEADVDMGDLFGGDY